MKSVEAQKAWRDATTKDRSFGATKIETAAKRPLADFAAELSNGLTVVCGLNGTGKTTLLRLVLRALSGRSTGLREDLVALGTFEVSLEVNGDQQVTPLGPGQPVAVAWLNAAEECAHLYQLARQPNFGDLAEGYDSSEWSAAEIEEARYVLGKQYSSIRVTEIDDPGPVEREFSSNWVGESMPRVECRRVGL